MEDFKTKQADALLADGAPGRQTIEPFENLPSFSVSLEESKVDPGSMAFGQGESKVCFPRSSNNGSLESKLFDLSITEKEAALPEQTFQVCLDSFELAVPEQIGEAALVNNKYLQWAPNGQVSLTKLASLPTQPSPTINVRTVQDRNRARLVSCGVSGQHLFSVQEIAAEQAGFSQILASTKAAKFKLTIHSIDQDKAFALGNRPQVFSLDEPVEQAAVFDGVVAAVARRSRTLYLLEGDKSYSLVLGATGNYSEQEQKAAQDPHDALCERFFADSKFEAICGRLFLLVNIQSQTTSSVEVFELTDQVRDFKQAGVCSFQPRAIVASIPSDRLVSFMSLDPSSEEELMIEIVQQGHDGKFEATTHALRLNSVLPAFEQTHGVQFAFQKVHCISRSSSSETILIVAEDAKENLLVLNYRRQNLDQLISIKKMFSHKPGSKILSVDAEAADLFTIRLLHGNSILVTKAKIFQAEPHLSEGLEGKVDLFFKEENYHGVAALVSQEDGFSKVEHVRHRLESIFHGVVHELVPRIIFLLGQQEFQALSSGIAQEARILTMKGIRKVEGLSAVYRAFQVRQTRRALVIRSDLQLAQLRPQEERELAEIAKIINGKLQKARVIFKMLHFLQQSGITRLTNPSKPSSSKIQGLLLRGIVEKNSRLLSASSGQLRNDALIEWISLAGSVGDSRALLRGFYAQALELSPWSSGTFSAIFQPNLIPVSEPKALLHFFQAERAGTNPDAIRKALIGVTSFFCSGSASQEFLPLLLLLLKQAAQLKGASFEAIKKEAKTCLLSAKLDGFSFNAQELSEILNYAKKFSQAFYPSESSAPRLGPYFNSVFQFAEQFESQLSQLAAAYTGFIESVVRDELVVESSKKPHLRKINESVIEQLCLASLSSSQNKIVNQFLEKERPFLLFARFTILKDAEAQTKLAERLLEVQPEAAVGSKAESQRRRDIDELSRSLVQQTEFSKLPTAFQSCLKEGRPSDIGYIEGFSFVKIKHAPSSQRKEEASDDLFEETLAALVSQQLQQ